jgi:hypothetical protein
MFWQYNSIYVFYNTDSPLQDVNIIKRIASYYIHPFIESRENILDQIVFNEINNTYYKLYKLEHLYNQIYHNRESSHYCQELHEYRFKVKELQNMINYIEISLEYLNNRKLTMCTSFTGHTIHNIIQAYWNDT